MIKDPQTGKAKRTPYEPGYRVRHEMGPDEFSEFHIPESAILGKVELAKGGKVEKPLHYGPGPVLSKADIDAHADRIVRQMAGKKRLGYKKGGKVAPNQSIDTMRLALTKKAK